MRTIRTKQNKKNNKRRGRKEVAENPVQTACTLARISLDYLIIHRATWEIDDNYLKPYYKGTITMTIKRLEKFLNKWKGLPNKDDYKIVQNRVLKTLEPYIDQVSTLNLDGTDDIIYKSMVVVTLCLGTMMDMVKRLGFMYANLEVDIKKVVNVFESYKSFWMKEVDTLIINFY